MKSKKKRYNNHKQIYTVNKTMYICEHKRVYYFPKGDKVELYDIVEIIVRESGNHRIKTADGNLHIVASGWLHIEIEGFGDWVF